MCVAYAYVYEKDRGDTENLSRCEETHLRSALVSEGGVKAWPWIHLPEFLWFSLPAILRYHLKKIRFAECSKHFVYCSSFFLLTLIMCYNLFSWKKNSSVTENEYAERLARWRGEIDGQNIQQLWLTS